MEYLQRWDDVLFLHWAVPVEVVRRFVPPPLEIDLHEGQAWVSAVFFRLQVRLHWLPFVPGVSRLVEMNVRTYVQHQGRSGIWFLSVHASNRLAVRLARWLTPIPYEPRSLHYQNVGNRSEFRSLARPTLAVTFTPQGMANATAIDSRDEWLLERYRLFSRTETGELMEAEVSHPRWVVRPVELSGRVDVIGREMGLDLGPWPDVAHFSAGVRAKFGTFRHVASTLPNQVKQSVSVASPILFTS